MLTALTVRNNSTLQRKVDKLFLGAMVFLTQTKKLPRLPRVCSNAAKAAIGFRNADKRAIQGHFLPSQTTLDAWLRALQQKL